MEGLLVGFRALLALLALLAFRAQTNSSTTRPTVHVGLLLIK